MDSELDLDHSPRPSLRFTQASFYYFVSFIYTRLRVGVWALKVHWGKCLECVPFSILPLKRSWEIIYVGVCFY